MGQIAMAYPQKLVTRQVTPTPEVQQTATGPAPVVANNYRKATTQEMGDTILGMLKQRGGLFGVRRNPLSEAEVTADLNKRGLSPT